MSDTGKLPLWQALHTALLDSTGTCDFGVCGEVPDMPTGPDYAPVIRAVADWIEQLDFAPDHTLIPGEIAEALRLEAQRAEAGE